MNTNFRERFWRDVRNIKNEKMTARIEGAIAQVAAAKSLSEIKHLEKIAGTSNAFRIRVGDFRIGFHLEKDTVEFVRCLGRKDMYRSFPES